VLPSSLGDGWERGIVVCAEQTAGDKKDANNKSQIDSPQNMLHLNFNEMRFAFGQIKLDLTGCNALRHSKRNGADFGIIETPLTLSSRL
jgi:hypothetical protein